MPKSTCKKQLFGLDAIIGKYGVGRWHASIARVLGRPTGIFLSVLQLFIFLSWVIYYCKECEGEFAKTL